MNNIAANTTMGTVTLNVANLERMTRFYRDGVGLSLLSEEPGGIVKLGRGNRVLLVLKHTPSLKHAGPSDAGLFHTAILFEDQPSLAASIVNVAQLFSGSFTGSADHLVSEAFYFNDPEGNGVELYYDRPRETWRIENGEIIMDTLYLDPNDFVQNFVTEESLAGHQKSEVSVGHVHLSVGDIPTAKEFYVNRLGFDQTFDWNNAAVFVSAGGYHHHMAMNIWRSRGAGVRGQVLGLGVVEIDLPTADDMGTVVERLRHHGHDLRDDAKTIEVDDPWGNIVRLAVSETTAPLE